MKTTSLLSFSALLALASMVASVGCSQPVVQPFGEEDDEEESGSASSKKSSKKSSSDDEDEDTSSSSSNNNDQSSNPEPTDPTTPEPTDPTTPPSDDPLVCFDQCAASGPAAQYWSCSANCQDMQCDDNCWFQSQCGQNEDACIQALDACNAQCGDPFGQGQ
jgi:hypothetical protein